LCGNASLYKGDTIVYNADSFKTGTEKLEHFELPGVEVNADGN
jgi:hypothetical protein